ncbi:MAG: hypothetical protein HZB13_00960 [Acidobacteria bacterium]|nr:hypothetical protein [Acidobacteriota bacterium]
MRPVIQAANLASLVLAVAASAFVCVAPIYSPGKTILQVSGSVVLISISVPILASLAPILMRRRAMQIGAAAMLCCFVLLAGFSIGLFYAPSALLLLPGCFRSTRRGIDDDGQQKVV